MSELAQSWTAPFDMLTQWKVYAPRPLGTRYKGEGAKPWLWNFEWYRSIQHSNKMISQEVIVSIQVVVHRMRHHCVHGNLQWHLRHLWGQRDVPLSVKGRIYTEAVRSALLYRPETRSLGRADMRRPLVSENGCFRKITIIWWWGFHEMRSRILGYSSVDRTGSEF